MRTEYEYLRTDFDFKSGRVILPAGDYSTLADLGLAGWRMCGFERVNDNLSFAYVAVFVRPLETQPES